MKDYFFYNLDNLIRILHRALYTNQLAVYVYHSYWSNSIVCHKHICFWITKVQGCRFSSYYQLD